MLNLVIHGVVGGGVGSIYSGGDDDDGGGGGGVVVVYVLVVPGLVSCELSLVLQPVIIALTPAGFTLT